ncbi:MAG: hypothetical protein ACI8Q2_000297 [Candidatus Omnitrophota bacterium]|jgi:hypothetical protein
MNLSVCLGVVFMALCLSNSQAHASGAIEAKQQAAMEQKQAQQRALNQRGQQNQSQHNNKQQLINDYRTRTQEQVRYEPVIGEVLPLKDVWKELEVSSEIWGLMIDDEPKRVTVENYVRLFAKKGISIRKDPGEYLRLIDEMAQSNVQLLSTPFHNVLRFVAIVNYDFDNGVDRDVLAKQLLGEAGYLSNRRRLGIE